MKHLIVVFSFIAVHFLNGQTFEAQVIDLDTRKPLSLVRVQVLETGISGSTDSAGVSEQFGTVCRIKSRCLAGDRTVSVSLSH